jgi:hypothetical protein
MTHTLAMLAGPLYGYMAACTMLAAERKVPSTGTIERIGLVIAGLAWPVVIGSAVIYKIIR